MPLSPLGAAGPNHPRLQELADHTEAEVTFQLAGSRAQLLHSPPGGLLTQHPDQGAHADPGRSLDDQHAPLSPPKAAIAPSRSANSAPRANSPVVVGRAPPAMPKVWGPNFRYPTLKPPSSDLMPPHQHRHHTLNRHATSKSHRFSAIAQILAEKGAVMHPYLNYVYVTMVREERERQAEHQRLVALARRLRRQHWRIKTPHASIGVLRQRRTPALQPRQPEIAPEHPELRPGRCCMGASPRAAGLADASSPCSSIRI